MIPQGAPVASSALAYATSQPDNYPNQQMYCPECGAGNPADHIFCNSCGEKLPAGAPGHQPADSGPPADQVTQVLRQPAPPLPPTPPVMKKSRSPLSNRVVTIAVVMIIVIAALAGGAFYLMSGDDGTGASVEASDSGVSPGDTLKKFFENIADGNSGDAYDMLAQDSSARDRYSKDEFVKLMEEQAPEGSEIISYEVLEEDINGDKATVKYKGKFKTPNKSDDYDEKTVELVKEDGEWKIVEMGDDYAGGPADTVREYFKGFAKGNYGDCYDLFAEDSEVRKRLAKKEFVEMVEEGGRGISISAFEILEHKIDGDRATIKYRITGKASSGEPEETEEDAMVLVKEDGEWKILE